MKMQRIIDGLCYDTTKATAVASYCFSQKGEPDYCEETLYRTKSGRYFLHCMGSAECEWGWQLQYIISGDGEGLAEMDLGYVLLWLEIRGKGIPAGCPEIEELVTEA